MTTRRRFIQSMAALPSLLALPPARAAADPSRVALVVGNAAYLQSPLTNPVNDAGDMAELLSAAGISVDKRINANRVDLMAAIDRFGEAARRSDTRLAIFYYAGHGVQLDWRNYLLPIDAQVTTAAQLKQHCIDLGAVMEKFVAGKDKNFVVILDACRNNPFGSAYRPEQKGLSQFDAPAGSLLAYATSPGNVASDGARRNGLYTEHLVRELSAKGLRIEDALKRVRLNVRLASEGAQIPWETTSLEDDVYIFGEPRAKPGDAELQRELEAEIEAWSGIKDSNRVDDWVGYLRRYPNGRFAEIAQYRLNRLMADVKLASIAAVPAPAPAAPIPVPAALPPAAAPAAPAAPPAIDLKPGAAVPALVQPSQNPYSAGRYPLGRTYTVGDEATMRESDLLTDVEVKTYTLRVTRVAPAADRVEINDGAVIWDMMGNSLKNGPVSFDVPLQFAPAEFQLGKKWTAAFRRNDRGSLSYAYYDMRIAALEKVKVPAGEFLAFRVEGEGWNQTFGAKLEVRLWLVPGVGFPIKREWTTRNRRGQFMNTERHELVSLRQAATGGAP